MKIQNGIIFIWTGMHASIPSGWSRVTDMDDRYPKGTAASTNPNTTGGASTHSHTSPAHTHTAQAHTHTITIGAGSGSSTNTGGHNDAVLLGHTHNAFTSGAVSNFSCQSTAVTYGASSNDPPYYGVIYVTPTAVVSSLPSGIVALADAVAPSGFNICDGTSGTPNLVDKYLKGATTGGNAGTTGGGTTNTHSITHTHTTSHDHAGATSGGGTDATRNTNAGGGSVVLPGHTHTVTLNAATPTLSDTLSLVTTETVEPAYTKLLAIQAASQSLIPRNIIAMWLGTLSTIPAGWILCDGTNGTVDMRERHLKITGTVGSVGETGGSNTHTHTSQNHDHAGVSHSHTAPNATHSGTNAPEGSSGLEATAVTGTVHGVSTDSVNLVVNTGSTTADSSNNEPPYRTVAFIKLNQRIENATFILNMLT